MANPSGDGIPNALKLALGLDPTLRAANALPAPSASTTLQGSVTTLDIPLNPAAVAGGLAGWALSALDESWQSGTRTVQDLPFSARWFTGLSAGTLTSSPGRLSQSIASSSALVATYFTDPGEVIQLGIGDSLRVHFRLSFTGMPADDLSFVRFGLFDTSMNSRLTADNQGNSNAAFNSATGYATLLSSPAAGTSVVTRVRAGTATNALLNVISAYTDLPGATTMAASMQDGMAYDVTLEITRVSTNQTDIRSALRGPSGTLYAHSTSDSTHNYERFDTFAIISSGNNGNAYHLESLGIQVGPSVGMGIRAEVANALAGDTWRPLRPREFERLDPAHGRIRLAMDDASQSFVRLRAEGVDHLEQSRFVDRTAELGLPEVGGNVVWVDYNNDGWVDLIAGGRLFINNHGEGFTQTLTGLGRVVAGDFDNDGWPDLYSYSDHRLMRNFEGAAWIEVPLPPLEANHVSQAAIWGDLNGNGRLDLYISGYEDWDNNITYRDYVLLNQGDGTFSIAHSFTGRRARGVTTCDFDRNATLDIYVSNYRLQPNILWRNDGSANLTNVAAAYNAVATSPGFNGGHSIGAAWGDFNNSGWFDLFAGNFAHPGQPQSRFLRNTGPIGSFHFEDMGTGGVFYQESYATPAAGDFDNDGRLDLIFTTVYGIASGGIPNYPVLFRNRGDFTFEDVTEAAGLAQRGTTYQAAWADFNNNGQLDLYLDSRLFVNQGNSHNWLKVRLRGDGQAVNRSAIGAQVRIHLAGETLSRQVEAGTGRGNQNDFTLHFGLAHHPGPFDLEVFWPNGTTRIIPAVSPNQLVVVDYE